MADTTTVTIRIPMELRERLDRLAKGTRRSRSYLAAQALDIYTRYELQIVEQILEGIEDVRAGRVVSHAEVVAQGRAIIEQARAREAAKIANETAAE